MFEANGRPNEDVGDVCDVRREHREAGWTTLPRRPPERPLLSLLSPDDKITKGGRDGKRDGGREGGRRTRAATRGKRK